MGQSSKLGQILLKFDNCRLQSNEELSRNLYYAHCALPIYESANRELMVKTSNSANVGEIDLESWQLDLAENIALMLRCMVSMCKVENGDSKGGYYFCFIGVEDDAEIASKIFDCISDAIVYRSSNHSVKQSFLNLINGCGFKPRKNDKKGFKDVGVFENKENIKSLVEDISDFSGLLKSNEFGHLISRYFMKNGFA